MSFYPGPKLERWLAIMAGCAAVGIMVLLIVAMVIPRRVEVGAPSKARARAEKVSPPAADYRAVSAASASVRPAAPVKEASREEVARAMNLSSARSLVAELKTAAVAGDVSTRKSTLMALGRYGKTVQSLLDEELARASDTRVREALSEALDRVH